MSCCITEKRPVTKLGGESGGPYGSDEMTIARAYDILKALPPHGGPRNGKFTVCCPAHDDRKPSLSVELTEDGVCLVNCHAGCETRDVMKARGLAMKDLFPETPKRRQAQARAARAIASPTSTAASAPDKSNGHQQIEETLPSQTGPTPRHLTDLGNARRLVFELSSELRFCHTNGKWYVWDGQRWALDETAEVMRFAKLTALDILTEAAKIEDNDKCKELVKHAMRSQSEPKLRAMLKLAESELGIPVLLEEFDCDPFLLNVKNGTIDLRTGELKPHRRDDLITRIIKVPYDPSATCPVWDRFLFQVLGGSTSLVEFLCRAVGYSLTGDTREHVLFFLHGAGANGKSTMLNVLLSLLGAYGKQVEPDLLLVRHGDAHPTGLADLEGARLAVAMEIEDGRRLAESLVKQITGGDRLTARKMRQDFREFWPTHKTWLGANHKPNVKGTDNAIWRRIHLIPFNVTISRGEQDQSLPAKLKEEFPGILAWAVRGCLEWAANGLGIPDEVAEATAAYRAEEDILAGFLSEHCSIEPSAKVGSTELVEAYRKWSGTNISQKALAPRLRERGFERIKTRSGVRWRGLRLLGSEPCEPS